MLWEQPAVSIATVLVHEATHARLHRWKAAHGVIRSRVDAACVREQLDFALANPNAGWLVQWSRKALDRLGEPLEQAIRDRQLQRLRELGAPSWIVRLTVLLWPDNY